MLSGLAERKREVPADFDRVARTYDTLVRRTRIYRYLRRSVLDFDTVAGFEARLGRAGFADVHTEPVDGWQRGFVHSFCARAPSAP